MNKLGYLGMYLLGALTGSVAVFFVLNEKYKKIADDEINEIRNLYKEQTKKFKEETEAYQEEVDKLNTELKWKELEDLDDDDENDDEMTEYDRFVESDILKHQDHNQRVNYSSSINYKDIPEEDRPYREDDAFVIAPEHFGEDEDMDVCTLYYFADGTLTDDNYVPVDDVTFTVGEDALDSFGTYEEDCVYVENPKLHSYFEILKDPRTFDEYTDEHPNDE